MKSCSRHVTPLSAALRGDLNRRTSCDVTVTFVHILNPDLKIAQKKDECEFESGYSNIIVHPSAQCSNNK